MLALLVIVTEFLGPLGLAVGLRIRVVAFGLLCEMLVAIVTVHGPNGFWPRSWDRPLYAFRGGLRGAGASSTASKIAANIERGF